MRHKLICVVALAIIGLSSVHAEERVDCPVSAIPLSGMAIAECATQSGVVIFRYRDNAPVEPYSTEFDRRFLAIAVGERVNALYEVAGIKLTPRGLKQKRTVLVQPPVAHQILTRKSTAGVRRHHAWTILSEIVQYAEQGGSPGFVIECATGVRSKKGGSAVVSECFPLESRSRFLRTLDSVR
jgi:hypothetical protein